jgi:hypothetical protein
MEKNQAIQILEQALNAAILKGGFTIKDVESIINALITLKQ